MSAAATAAGYLYASGRLRNRAARGEEAGPTEQAPRQEERAARREERAPRRADAAPRRKEPLVGRIPAEPAREPRERREPRAEPGWREPEKQRPAPRVEYRTRRWRREI